MTSNHPKEGGSPFRVVSHRTELPNLWDGRRLLPDLVNAQLAELRLSRREAAPHGVKLRGIPTNDILAILRELRAPENFSHLAEQALCRGRRSDRASALDIVPLEALRASRSPVLFSFASLPLIAGVPTGVRRVRQSQQALALTGWISEPDTQDYGRPIAGVQDEIEPLLLFTVRSWSGHSAGDLELRFRKGAADWSAIERLTGLLAEQGHAVPWKLASKELSAMALASESSSIFVTRVNGKYVRPDDPEAVLPRLRTHLLLSELVPKELWIDSDQLEELGEHGGCAELGLQADELCEVLQAARGGFTESTVALSRQFAAEAGRRAEWEIFVPGDGGPAVLKAFHHTPCSGQSPVTLTVHHSPALWSHLLAAMDSELQEEISETLGISDPDELGGCDELEDLFSDGGNLIATLAFRLTPELQSWAEVRRLAAALNQPAISDRPVPAKHIVADGADHAIIQLDGGLRCRCELRGDGSRNKRG